MTLPGQYEYQRAIFRQDFYPPPPQHNGVFLAGETTSWAGGWIEGALHSGLDAARVIIARLGGTVHAVHKLTGVPAGSRPPPTLQLGT